MNAYQDSLEKFFMDDKLSYFHQNVFECLNIFNFLFLEDIPLIDDCLKGTNRISTENTNCFAYV